MNKKGFFNGLIFIKKKSILNLHDRKPDVMKLSKFEKSMAKILNNEKNNKFEITPEELQDAWKKLMKRIERMEKLEPKHWN